MVPSEILAVAEPTELPGSDKLGLVSDVKASIK